MIKNGYASRNIPSFAKFENTYNTRISAKKAGDKSTANNLKLVLNTCYGATLNQYNDLYDPLQARSVCISGQLYLSELANHLYTEVEGLKIVSLNTDGIMVEFDDSQYDKVLTITQEWQERTGFELEEDKIKKVCQANVNNYILIMEDGSVKTKGGYLVRGIAPAGAFNINNNATIVAKAIVEYFVNDTPPEDTINNCNDIFSFQIIAKAGSKYKEAYHLVDGQPQPVQKVNRVYATADERYGKIYKVKAADDATAKIESLPEHCIIDNDNHLTIEAVDKTFYIEMARKRINDFIGVKPTKNKNKNTKETNKMATTSPKTMNVYQKLLKARATFLGANAKKSGKNMTLAFKYFELDDIVPIATNIFEEIGLLSVVNFTADTATLTIVNTENGSESIDFTAPMVISEGNKAVTPVQALGATITYFRRYLYMMALDICEPDEIDSVGATPPKSAPATNSTPTVATKPTTPATANTSENKPLTSGSGNASETQIRQLKDLLIKLKEKDPASEEAITEIAIQTQGFTVISKADCEALVIKIGEKLKVGEERVR